MLQLDEDTLTIEGLTPCCEHPDHTRSKVHDDGDEHYARVLFACKCRGDEIRVFCHVWLAHLAAWGTIFCTGCETEYPLDEALIDLGPVAAYH